MEMHAGKDRAEEDTKGIATFLSDLVDEIIASDRVAVSLSEATVEVFSRQYDISYNSPTGDMTLVVSWKRNETKKKSAISRKRFEEIATEVEEEMGYSGLTDHPYGEFALRVAERYITEVGG